MGAFWEATHLQTPHVNAFNLEPKGPVTGTLSVILYSTILYYTILYYTILYYTILYYTILYYTILYYTILYYTILYHATLYSTLPLSRLLKALTARLSRGTCHRCGVPPGAEGVLD